ncbi:hypothetical protein B0H10DRAFT_1954856 [Mycena sp. CBHHK59/15]|nr:hypothetical protein B0H10DRAFT_1954856 [Mycena sp. CBHHK59/15]
MHGGLHLTNRYYTKTGVIGVEMVAWYVLEDIPYFWQFGASLSPRLSGLPDQRQACSEPTRGPPMPSQKLVAPQRLHLNHRRCRSGRQTHLRLSQEEIEAEGALMEALRHAEVDADAEEDARLDDGAVEIHSEDEYLG